MNKKIITLLLATAAISGSAQASFGFGFSSGNFCGPNVGFGMSIPLDDCHGPRLGFGFSAPICRPVQVVHRVPVRIIRTAPVVVQSRTYLDNEDYAHWVIYNDTNKTIKATNRSGKTITIRPGTEKKLSHANGYNLKVRFAGSDNEYATVKRTGHQITVKYRGGILVFDNDEFFDDSDEESEESEEYEFKE